MRRRILCNGALRRAHRTLSLLIVVAFVLGVSLDLAAPTQIFAATLPSSFQEKVVISGLVQPTELAFAPDGRIFVAEKRGIIKVFSGLSDTNPTIFADLRSEVSNFWDRGLLGMTLDPQFTSGRPYVYVLYTHDSGQWATSPNADSDPCPTPPGATDKGCVVDGRLSRLTARGNLMDTEQVLVEDWCQQYPSHSVGTLAFGPDGALYASAGDGASFNWTDYGQEGSPVNPCGDPPGGIGAVQTPPTARGGALRAQSLRRPAGEPVVLNGAVLRLNPDTGAAKDTNPLANSNSANTQRIIAYGLRNPFRFVVRPETSTSTSSELWVGDVGMAVWEDVDRIGSSSDSAVDNFGWPCYEGPERQGGYDSANLTLCETLYKQTNAITPPVYSYSHYAKVISGESCGSGNSSVTGMAFYNGGNYPSSYAGALFFADYARNCIWVMPKGSSSVPDPALRATFVAAAASPVSLKIGPGGDLFYVDHLGGTIRRIQYYRANQPPIARVQATPTNGIAPLQVQFDARSSTDADGDALAYAWDLDGDNDYDDSNQANPTFTYTQPGTYAVKVQVTDTAGATDTEAVLISANNTPPTALIDAPLATLPWKVNDTISFSGHATDDQQGTLAAAALTWDVILHHCFTETNCHAHPLQTFTGVASGSFSAPDHEYPSYLEMKLTATDAGGLQSTASVLLYPRTVQQTINSIPSGMQISFNGSYGITPFTRTVILESRNSISAPVSQVVSGVTFTSPVWSDSGAQSHNIIADVSTTSYTAVYSVAQAPTNTPTNTPTNAPTNAPTSTLVPATSTPTSTSTSTPTNASTNTPTNTPVPATSTPTSTSTSTPTNAPTSTSVPATNTPTNTPTSMPTNTPVRTPANTPTRTATGTPTRTATGTPTRTATGTPTRTATPTNTPSPTAIGQPITNLLANGGLENGSLSGWETTGGITVAMADRRSGSYGAGMALNGRIDHVFATTAGKTYYVVAYLRINQLIATPQWGGLRVQVVNATWAELGSVTVTPANTPLGQWKRLTFSFTATSATSRLIYQSFSGGGQFNASADDFAVSTSPIP